MPARGERNLPNVDCSIIRSTRRALAVILLSGSVSCAPWAAHAGAEPDRAPGSIAAVAAKASPAVVRIITMRPPNNEAPKAAAAKPEGAKSGDKPATGAPTDQATSGVASGFIIDPSGYVATNKHVIEGATSVYVVTADGVRYPATVTGTPGKTDIALLRIEPKDRLASIPFGDSDKMRVGDIVIAIGSPFGFDTSVTSGIISGVNRDIMESPFDEYLQTDAAINHGNSGGPLLNLCGEVIGMNSVIFAPTTGSAGVGFAVPSNVLQFVFDRLMKAGEVRAGMLPLRTQPVNWMLEQALNIPDLHGALITSVQIEPDKMPRGELKPGDVIRRIDGQTVLDPRDLARKVARAPIGGDAALEIYRGGAIQTIHIPIEAWPEAQPIVLHNDRQRSIGLELASDHAENGKPIVMVASVDPTGTAFDSGIKPRDIILEVQQTPVSEPDQALRIFSAESSMRHHFAAVLVQRDKKLSWVPIAIPE